MGYLLGAYMTSITSGLVMVFALPQSSTASTARNTLSPAMDLALGLIALVVALVLGTGPHDLPVMARPKRRLGPPDILPQAAVVNVSPVPIKKEASTCKRW